MIPYIQKGDLTKLHGKRRNAICGCKQQCKTFYTFITDDEENDFILCLEDAKQFAFEILEDMGAVKKRLFTTGKQGPYNTWRSDEERIVLEYFKNHECIDENGKVKFGIYTAIGELLDRPRKQVQWKVKTLRKQGKL